VTFAIFVLGLSVGRSRFLATAPLHRNRLFQLFAGFTGLTIALNALQAVMPEQNIRVFFRADGVQLSWELVGYQALSDLSLVTYSGALICGFLLLYYSKMFGAYLDILSPYGRAALTNYIMQGVIGSILFAPWAFGFTFGSWGLFALVMLGLLIYIIQWAVSYVWLKYYLYGPLEWLWRTGTYMSRQPFTRKLVK